MPRCLTVLGIKGPGIFLPRLKGEQTMVKTKTLLIKKSMMDSMSKLLKVCKKFKISLKKYK